MKERLYLVVRSDLPPGLQMSQVVHAMVAFDRAHPGISEAWQDSSNTISILSVPNEASLRKLADEIDCSGDAPWVPFYEPDLAGSMTALALGPGYTSQRMVRGLLPALDPKVAYYASAEFDTNPHP